MSQSMLLSPLKARSRSVHLAISCTQGSAVRPRLQLPSKEVAKPVSPATRKLTNTEINLELKELLRGSKIVLSSKQQRRIISRRIKTKGPICSKCSSRTPKSEACRWNKNCSKCNEVHIHDMCNIKKYFSCSMSARSNSCLMSLQDIPLNKSRSLARVMFDNSSEVMLVS